MSKIANSGQEFWRQDTPLPLPTWTTSDAEKLEVTERSTRMSEESQLRFKLCIAVVVSVALSFFMTRMMIIKPDGLIRLGFTDQKMKINGHEIEVLIPIYATPDTYYKLQEMP